MYNDLFTIGKLTVHGYGLMVGIGTCLALWDVDRRYARSGLRIRSGDLTACVIWCILGGTIGSKLLYWLTILDSIRADPALMLSTLTSGFVVYGGILGALAAGPYCSRRYGIPFLQLADTLFPSFALAQGFGRIGCFLAGCCYGMGYDGVCSVTFQNSLYAPNGIPLFPTQLLSSALDFANWVLLSSLYKKKPKFGLITSLYLVLYSVGRFILEFFRGDTERGSVGVLSTSQFIALFTAAAGVLLLIHVCRSRARAVKIGE